MRTSILAVLVAATAACSSSSGSAPAAGSGSGSPSAAGSGGPSAAGTSAPTATPLAEDLQKICNAIELSGAAELPENDRMYTMAQWLPANVSAAGRQWLIRFAQLGTDSAARRKMLEADSRAAGLADCPLVAAWQ